VAQAGNWFALEFAGRLQADRVADRLVRELFAGVVGYMARRMFAIWRETDDYHKSLLA
jgi:hypothetical protein